jgi:hypothetical protein
MDAGRIAELEAKGVHALPMYSVESFYYSAEVLQAVASQQALNLGAAADELLFNAKALGLAALQSTGKVEHLAGKMAEHKMRDAIMLSIPDRQSMIEGNGTPTSISILSPYPRELERLRALVAAQNIGGIVAGYPVRESGVLGAFARGLRFIGQQDYERAALTRIGADKSLQLMLKSKLGSLAAQLE